MKVWVLHGKIPTIAMHLKKLYISDDLLMRNIVTCIIRPKINIIQIDLACRRIFTVIVMH